MTKRSQTKLAPVLSSAASLSVYDGNIVQVLSSFAAATRMQMDRVGSEVPAAAAARRNLQLSTAQSRTTAATSAPPDTASGSRDVAGTVEIVPQIPGSRSRPASVASASPQAAVVPGSSDMALIDQLLKEDDLLQELVDQYAAKSKDGQIFSIPTKDANQTQSGQTEGSGSVQHTMEQKSAETHKHSAGDAVSARCQDNKESSAEEDDVPGFVVQLPPGMFFVNSDDNSSSPCLFHGPFPDDKLPQHLQIVQQIKIKKEPVDDGFETRVVDIKLEELAPEKPVSQDSLSSHEPEQDGGVIPNEVSSHDTSVNASEPEESTPTLSKTVDKSLIKSSSKRAEREAGSEGGVAESEKPELSEASVGLPSTLKQSRIASETTETNTMSNPDEDGTQELNLDPSPNDKTQEFNIVATSDRGETQDLTTSEVPVESAELAEQPDSEAVSTTDLGNNVDSDSKSDDAGSSVDTDAGVVVVVPILCNRLTKKASGGSDCGDKDVSVSQEDGVSNGSEPQDTEGAVEQAAEETVDEPTATSDVAEDVTDSASEVHDEKDSTDSASEVEVSQPASEGQDVESEAETDSESLSKAVVRDVCRPAVVMLERLEELLRGRGSGLGGVGQDSPSPSATGDEGSASDQDKTDITAATLENAEEITVQASEPEPGNENGDAIVKVEDAIGWEHVGSKVALSPAERAKLRRGRARGGNRSPRAKGVKLVLDKDPGLTGKGTKARVRSDSAVPSTLTESKQASNTPDEAAGQARKVKDGKQVKTCVDTKKEKLPAGDSGAANSVVKRTSRRTTDVKHAIDKLSCLPGKATKKSKVATKGEGSEESDRQFTLIKEKLAQEGELAEDNEETIATDNEKKQEDSGSGTKKGGSLGPKSKKGATSAPYLKVKLKGPPKEGDSSGPESRKKEAASVPYLKVNLKKSPMSKISKILQPEFQPVLNFKQLKPEQAKEPKAKKRKTTGDDVAKSDAAELSEERNTTPRMRKRKNAAGAEARTENHEVHQAEEQDGAPAAKKRKTSAEKESTKQSKKNPKPKTEESEEKEIAPKENEAKKTGKGKRGRKSESKIKRDESNEREKKSCKDVKTEKESADEDTDSVGAGSNIFESLERWKESREKRRSDYRAKSPSSSASRSSSPGVKLKQEPTTPDVPKGKKPTGSDSQKETKQTPKSFTRGRKNGHKVTEQSETEEKHEAKEERLSASNKKKASDKEKTKTDSAPNTADMGPKKTPSKKPGPKKGAKTKK